MKFDYELYEDGIRLLQYYGDETTIEIPSSIDGKKVLALAPSLFVEEGLNLESISVPGSIECLEKDTFDSCFMLSEIKLHEGLKILKDGFMGSSVVKTLYIPKTIEEIDGIARFPIPLIIDDENPNYMSDGYGIYERNDDGLILKGLIPQVHKDAYKVLDHTVLIDHEALFNQESDLETLILPSSLKEIKTAALHSTLYTFEKERGILNYIVEEDHPVFTFKEGFLLERLNNGKTVLLAQTKDIDIVRIPNDVNIIGKYAFLNANVKTIVLNKNLEQIEKDAFFGTLLEEVVYTNSNQVILFPKKHEVLRDEMLVGFGKDGIRYDYKDYDALLLKNYISAERVRMISGRLKYKDQLSKENELRYMEILETQMVDAIRYICERNDTDSLKRLLDVGLIHNENIDACLKVVGDLNNTKAMAILLDYQHLHLSNEAFDFSL